MCVPKTCDICRMTQGAKSIGAVSMSITNYKCFILRLKSVYIFCFDSNFSSKVFLIQKREVLNLPFCKFSNDSSILIKLSMPISQEYL